MKNLGSFNPSPKEVGQRVREERRRVDLTLSDLSAKTGASVSTLSLYEQGTRFPTLQFLFNLGKLGFDVDYIFYGPPQIADPRISDTQAAFAALYPILEELHQQRNSLGGDLERISQQIERLNILKDRLEAASGCEVG